MNAARCLGALLVAALLAAPAASARERAGPVGDWIEFELDEIAAQRLNPPRAARALALVSDAMAKAARAPASRRRAAVDGAAATVLSYLFPERSEAIVGRVRRGRPGWARGRRAATRVIAIARRDGSDAVWRGTVPVGPGRWRPAPPSFGAPVEPLAGTWRTWHRRVERVPPPHALGSLRRARELREVYAVSQALTDEQRRIAARWADGPGTVTPAGHWNLIALRLIHRHGLTLRAAARVLAAMNRAQADAFIACWDVKYRYWSERPVTAIRREIDPGWRPLLPTPPFPSYVSGHATTSAAAASVLEAFFPAATGRLRASAREVAASRLYGGIHFRSDNEAGLALGRAIGTAVVP